MEVLDSLRKFSSDTIDWSSEFWDPDLLRKESMEQLDLFWELSGSSAGGGLIVS